MAKLKGPLFSQKASKQFGHELIYKTKGNKNLLTKYNKPGSVNPFTKSADQTQMRVIYGEGVEAWRNLSNNEKATYDERAKNKKYSGYNLFMKEYFIANPLISDFLYYGKKIYGPYEYGSG